MREIDEELTYTSPPPEVFALITDAAFQLALIAHLGGEEAEVVEDLRGPNGAVRLTTVQETATDLPAFARKIIPAHITVRHTFDWSPDAGDGVRRGTWAVEATGAPVKIGGATELRPDGRGTRHVYLGRVEASVPVVGGRLEGLALDNLRRDLALTGEFTAARLAAAAS
jgi:hypothetical protein